MIGLLLQNLRLRLLEWLRKPKKADVPRWTLKEIQALPKSEQDLFYKRTYEARRPLW